MGEQTYNWGVTGHDKQLGDVEKDLASGNLPHAYLFAGPAHIGKYTLAKRLTNILQCDSKGCGECAVCLNIEKGYHPDTIEINDDGESIKIEPMREILARLFTTTPGKYKILLIKNIERMTLETANALLKTLEEPPSKVFFLLTSSQHEELLPTVISRVRVLKLHGLVAGEIQKLLKEKYPLEPEEKNRTVTDLAFGLPGRAIRLMENEEDFEQVTALFDRVRDVLKKDDTVEKFALVNDATQDGPARSAMARRPGSEKLFGEFFDIFLLALRYTMLEEARAGKSSQKLQRTITALEQTQDAVRLQKRNVNARLLFEHLMLQT